jgi:hypothetical protein
MSNEIKKFKRQRFSGFVEIPSVFSKTEEQVHAEESQYSVNLLATIAEASTADEICARLNAQIKMFDERLDQDHEVGIKLVTYGQAVTFRITNLAYDNPILIFFYGETSDGHRVQLIQHVSQISFILMAMNKPDPEQPRRAFGFAQDHHLEAASNVD